MTHILIKKMYNLNLIKASAKCINVNVDWLQPRTLNTFIKFNESFLSVYVIQITCNSFTSSGCTDRSTHQDPAQSDHSGAFVCVIVLMIKIVGQDLARYTTHITCLADCMLQQILCILSSKESSGYPITSSTLNKDLWLVIRWASSGPFDFGSNETGICECLLTKSRRGISELLKLFSPITDAQTHGCNPA